MSSTPGEGTSASTAAVRVPPSHRRVARALAGDERALEELAARWSEAAAVAARLGPALLIRARRWGVEGPAVEEWRRQLLAWTAHGLRQSSALQRAAAALQRAGVDWVLLKGGDLAGRVYAESEERPSADLDLLVAPSDLPTARAALEKAGWRGLYREPVMERFLEQEGYCWAAQGADGAPLELHFRLWGWVPEGFASELLERSQRGSSLPAGGRQLPLAHCYVVAAVHLWLDPPPRSLHSWWDLERIAARAGQEIVDEVVEIAGRWDLQLPVSLASLYASALFDEAPLGEIGERLMAELRMAESWVAGRALRGDAAKVPFPRLVLARLLARRRRRNGWTALARRLWPHPGLVARGTPTAWPAAGRRLVFILERSGLGPLAARLRRRLNRLHGENGEELEGDTV